MSNYSSAYDLRSNYVQHPTFYMPMSTSASFSSTHSRSNPKFNLDLYNPNEYSRASFDYPSPSSSVIIHHHPHVHSPSPRPPLTPPSQAINRLRQINDELCYTLAKCDLDRQVQAPAPHHHIHHYPNSAEPSRSPSPRERFRSSSSSESEPIPRKRNARVTYKAHIPRRPNPPPEVDQLLFSTSDVYERDDAMTIDVYPTRDQGFVRQIRNRPDNQQPWFPDSPPMRRNSFSEGSTYRTPRGPDYDNRPITPNSRLANDKVRPRSSSVKFRNRPETAPNLLRQSADPYSSIPRPWRPGGSIKRKKFIGSHDPPVKPTQPHEPTWNPGGSVVRKKQFRALDPTSVSITKQSEPVWNPPGITVRKKPVRAFDPTSIPIPKTSEPVWNVSSKKPPTKPIKHFASTMKPELIAPVKKQTEHLKHKKVVIPHANPALKTRVANAESKVKSAWNEPTTTIPKPKPPPGPRPINRATTTLPPKPKSAPPASVKKPVSKPPIAPTKKPTPIPVSAKTDTGRSSLTDGPSKPMFESTPRNQSPIEDVDDLFDQDTEIPASPKAPETPVPEPDQGKKPTIKNGVLVHGDDRSRTPEISNRDEEEERLHNRSEPRVSPPAVPKAEEPSIIDDEEVNEPAESEAEDNSVVQNHDKSDTAASPTPRAKDPSPEPSFAAEEEEDQPVSPAPPRPPAPATTTTTTTNDNNIDDFFD